MKTIKQFTESKAAEKGERDVGSKAYTDYAIDMTPGAVSNVDAKKSDRETKKTNALKIHRATRLDDAKDPEIVQANSQYKREKDQLRKQHIKNVADIRSNKIGENLVPDPVPVDAYDYKTKKGAIAAPGSGSIAKAKKAKASDVNKSIEQQMADARKEGWVELDPSDVLIEYENEEVEEDATYSERISSDVPAGNASGAKGTSKSRKYKQITPGQVRDYEKLTANRMFQAYEESEVEEDAPANATGPAIANWNPLLGDKKSPRVYVRKRRRIDARTKDYREAIKRTQARRDATMARDTEKKLNMFGVQSNPFKEETEMKNKKYLTTKEGSLEAAALESVVTETPVNPNTARPTLHLPNKYLASKADSLERAVTEVVTERDVSGEMRFDLKRLTGAQFRGKYRMTKAAAMTAGGGITHKGGRAVLRPRREEVEEIGENGNHPPKKPYKLPRQLKDPKKEKMVGTKKGTKVVDRDDPKYAKHPEHESVEMATELDQKEMPTKKIAKKLKPKSLYPPNKPIHKITGDQVESTLDEKEVDVKDTRRTVDAIRAYDRSKDASRDADWDTEHGKKGKGKKEKKYAKKERGEIDKDDPDWKHKKYHTGMHGEERSAADAALLDKAKRRHAQDKRERDTEKLPAPKSEEVSPLMKATIDELSKKTLVSYAKKAGQDMAATAMKPDTGPTDWERHKSSTKKMQHLDKRRRGLGKAADKLSKEETDWQSMSDQQKKAKAKAQFDAILKKKQGNPKDYESPIKTKEEVEIDEAPYAIGSWQTQGATDSEVKSNVGAKRFKSLQLRRKTQQAGRDKRKAETGYTRHGGSRAKKEEVVHEDKLSYKERQGLAKSQFALPGKGSGPEGKQGGSYPIPDASHARNALARVSQHGTEAEKAQVRRAVHKKFPDIKVSEGVMRDLLAVELDETHDRSPDKSGGKQIQTPDTIQGVKVQKLKPSLKGMSKAGKMMHKHREKAQKEEVEITEAQSVDSAIGVIDSIVKNKQAGEIIHGDRKKSKVDLYTASAIQAVMKKASKSNQQKMEKLMSHSRQGLAKVADLSYSLVKK